MRTDFSSLGQRLLTLRTSRAFYIVAALLLVVILPRILVYFALGTGLVPFDKLFAYLKETAFDGWICMEENSRMGEAGVRQAAAFVRSTWRAA